VHEVDGESARKKGREDREGEPKATHRQGDSLQEVDRGEAQSFALKGGVEREKGPHIVTLLVKVYGEGSGHVTQAPGLGEWGKL
jgi:hypothetical protein